MLVSGANASREYRRLRHCIGPHDEARHAGLSFTHPSGAEFGTGFNPLSRSPVFLLDAALGNSGGSTISTWHDQGSAGLTMTADVAQTYTASNSSFGHQPTVSTAATAAAFESGGTSVLVSQPDTMYMCIATSEFTGSLFEVFTANGATYQVIGGESDWLYDAGTLQASSHATTGAIALCAIFNGSSSALYINSSGTAVSSANPGTNSITEPVEIMSTASGVTLTVAHMMIVSGSDSLAQRQQMFAYYASRFGVSAS